MNQTTWYSLFCLFGIWQNISNIKATVNRFVFIPAAESRTKFGDSNTVYLRSLENSVAIWSKAVI